MVRRQRTSGQARLARWMKKEQLTQREAAAILGVHFTHVNQILRGRRSVGLAVAVRIEARAGIPVVAWMETRVGDDAPVVVTIDGKAR